MRGCESCARFGGEYAGAVTALRVLLVEPQPLSRASRTALRDRLGSEVILD